jgi:hypothetical protein
VAGQGDGSHNRDGQRTATPGGHGDEGADWLHPSVRAEATVETYDDHRMAMCLSLLPPAACRSMSAIRSVSKTIHLLNELARLVRRQRNVM